MVELSDTLGKMSPERRSYTLETLPTHLANGRRAERLHQLLTTFDFLQAKVDALGPQSLIDDYESIDENGLKLVQGALQLAAHVLAIDGTQLRSQLYGRLMAHIGQELVTGLEQPRSHIAATWLRPLTACLASPGGCLLRTLVGHTRRVNAVAVTPDGQRVVSASSDNTLKVWDVESGAELFTLAGHTSLVHDVAIALDGRCAVSASSDSTIRIWDLKQGAALSTLRGHTDTVNAVAVTPDGRWIVSVSEDRTRRVWDMKSGVEVDRFEGDWGVPRIVTVTPDGCLMIANASENALRVWDLQRKEEKPCYLTAHKFRISAVRIMPDGRRAISASVDETLRVWDLATGTELAILKEHSAEAVAVASDGQRIVSAGDHMLKVWMLPRMAESNFNRLAWEPAVVNPVRTIRTYAHNPCAVAITPDGRRTISAGSDQTLRLWDLERHANQPTFHGHTDPVKAVTVAPDSRRAISASARNLKVWDIRGGAELRSLQLHTYGRRVVVTPDCCYALCFCTDSSERKTKSMSEIPFDTLVEIWDLTRLEVVRILQIFNRNIEKVALTLGGQRVVAVSDWSQTDSTVHVLDLGQQTKLRTLTCEKAERVTAFAPTEDGKCVVFAPVVRPEVLGPSEYPVMLWKLDWRRPLPLGEHTAEVRAIAVTPNSRRAISASTDGTLTVWDLCRRVKLYTLCGHTSSVYRVVVTPDGRRAISVSGDGTFKVWDLGLGEECITLNNNTDYVEAIKLTPDGLRAVCVSFDSTLRVWDLKSGEIIASFNADGPLKDCAITPDGVYVVAGEESGRIHFLRLEGLA